MKNKAGIILLVALFVFCLNIQIVEGGGQDSATFNITVTVLEAPFLELEYRDSNEFESSSAVVKENDNSLIMKIYEVGTTLISTNIPWKLFAEPVECGDEEIYIRISDENNIGWIPVNDEPVLVSGATGEFELSWDIKVVKEGIDKDQPFELVYNLAPGDGYEEYFSEI